MSVSAVNGNNHVSSSEPAVNPQSPANPTKSSSSLPEDTVSLSPEAKSKQSGASADVDHDHDSK
jgi:hypothetical protein